MSERLYLWVEWTWTPLSHSYKSELSLNPSFQIGYSDTPVMSGFHMSTRLLVCSSRALSRLRALFHVGAWCSDPGTHVLSFGYVTGFGHSCFTFCLFVWVCVHSCYILCCEAHSLYIHWLRAFILSCLVWTRGLWVFSLAACSCPVLHMVVDLFAGHVLVFLFCVSTWLLS